MSEKEREPNRNHRRVKDREFRVIAVDGYNESRHGIQSKLNQMSQKQTHRLKSRNLSTVNAPIVKIPLDPALQKQLRDDGVEVSLNDKSFDLIEFVVKDKSAEDFSRLGLIYDKKIPNGDFYLSAYDTLYAYQLGLVGRDGRRKESFRKLMDYLEENDPYFKTRYIVYAELRNKNYIVMDGLRYGADLIIYEPLPPKILARLTELSDLDPKSIGSVDRTRFGLQSAGMIDVITPDVRMNEVIKGQHLAKKNDLRYFLARTKDDEVSFALIRRDRLRIDFNEKRDTLLINPGMTVGPFEFRGE